MVCICEYAHVLKPALQTASATTCGWAPYTNLYIKLYAPTQPYKLPLSHIYARS